MSFRLIEDKDLYNVYIYFFESGSIACPLGLESSVFDVEIQLR